MWMAIESVKNKTSDIILSAGNTGALFVIAKLNLNMIDNIDKPALSGLWPNKVGMNIVLDLGANIECNEKNLIDFAIMGSALHKSLFTNEISKVALLNIGSEELKGNNIIKNTYKELSKLNTSLFEFKGYVEGNQIMNGDVNVIISDEVIENCVELSQRYIVDRFLPDKAIDIMDEVCSRKRLNDLRIPKSILKIEQKILKINKEKENAILDQKFEKAANLRDKEHDLNAKLDDMQSNMFNKDYNYLNILIEDVADTISAITGIPLNKITQKESEKILNIGAELKNFIIGQDHAIKTLCEAIQRARAGFKNPNHPIGSFIFLGPSGVGKTELAKQLANNLFENDSSLIKIDMSEYMERYNVSRLIGAPPGYVGYEEGGLLTEKVRRNPYSIVLFDEIEKGHPDVFNLLLQILDEGHLTDSLGHNIDFRNTIIIMTSNIGTSKISSSNIGFIDKKEVDNKIVILDEVKKYFKPEFLNRIDDIITFDPLNKESLYKIIDLELVDLKNTLKNKKINLRISKLAKKILLEDGSHMEWGARPLRRIIQSKIETELSIRFLNNSFSENSTISITAKDGILNFNCTKNIISKKSRTVKK